MIDIIKGSLDVELKQPAVFPASFSGDRHCLNGRPAGTVAIRILVKERFQFWFQIHFHNRLSNTVRDRRDGGFIMHLLQSGLGCVAALYPG